MMHRFAMYSLALLLCAVLGRDCLAAAPAANTGLNVNVTVGIAQIVRIEWGTGSNGPTAGTTSAYTWDLNAGGAYVDLGQTVNSDDAAYNVGGSAQSFRVKNGGSRKVNLTAASSDDTAAAAVKWTLGTTTADNIFRMWINPDSAGYQAFTAPNVALPVKTDLKRSDAPFEFKLRYQMPPDIDRGWLPTIHTVTVTITATAS